MIIEDNGAQRLGNLPRVRSAVRIKPATRAVLAFAATWIIGMVSTSGLLAATPRRSGAGAGAGRLLFDGSFRPGTLRPWERVAVAGSRESAPRSGNLPQDIAIVQAPGLPRVWAARFSVEPNHIDSQGRHGGLERTELVASQQQTGAYPGQSAWYAWETYFPGSFRSTPKLAAYIAQAKRVGGLCGSPNIAFVVNSDAPRSGTALHTIRVLTSGGAIPGNDAQSGSTTACPGAVRQAIVLTRFKRRHWFHFLVHIGWGTDPVAGFVQVWIDGREVTPVIHTPTLYTNSEGAYWKQGLYERASPWPASVIQTGVRIGTTMAAVTPS